MDSEGKGRGYYLAVSWGLRLARANDTVPDLEADARGK